MGRKGEKINMMTFIAGMMVGGVIGLLIAALLGAGHDDYGNHGGYIV